MVENPEQLLDVLNPQQRQVAQQLTGPVCVLAGAGTGKTRAITHRIAYGVRTGLYQPQNILALTFTTKAAGELRSRLAGLGAPGVVARTFHAAALSQLSYFYPTVVGRSLPKLTEQKASILAQACKDIDLPVDRIVLRDLSSEIEWAKVNLISTNDYVSAAEQLLRPPPADLTHQDVARAMMTYEQLKSRLNTIDFEDVLLMQAHLMTEHDQVAQQVRHQYRRFVVDEFQDVSPLQYYLLRQWLGQRQELCVVGDPQQTIYSFAGASPHFLLDFPRQYPEATIVNLTQNYRSGAKILTLANTINTTGTKLQETKTDPGIVEFRTFRDDRSEAGHIAQSIRAQYDAGTSLNEIALIYRTNVQSMELEQALQREGLAYTIRGARQFFQRPDVRKAMSLLRVLLRDQDADIVAITRDAVSQLGWQAKAPDAVGAARERWESLQALVELAESFSGNATEFMADLVARENYDQAPQMNAVTLTTMHAAKGLEWPIVYLTGLSQGLMPISLARGPEQNAEEKRLLYVGITRAQSALFLSFAERQNPGGKRRDVSEFLRSLWPKTKPLGLAKQQHPRLAQALRQWQHDEQHTAAGLLSADEIQTICAKLPRSKTEVVLLGGLRLQTKQRYSQQIADLVNGYLSQASERPDSV